MEEAQVADCRISPNALNAEKCQGVKTTEADFSRCHPEQRSDKGSAVAWIGTLRTGLDRGKDGNPYDPEPRFCAASAEVRQPTNQGGIHIADGTGRCGPESRNLTQKDAMPTFRGYHTDK